eukprot:12728073-Alexandrium_andersonii.AAC.1
MSASLVGSEMCIRDRGCSARPTCLPCRAPPAPWAPRCRRARPTAPGSQAVSYTHLTLPTICSV